LDLVELCYLRPRDAAAGTVAPTRCNRQATLKIHRHCASIVTDWLRMKNRLKIETKRLQKSWMQYPETMLQDYLVEKVEDPRINIQSVLSRHFLIEGLFGNRFAALQKEELRFAAVMNWLLRLKTVAAEDAHDVLHALRKGMDNAAGIEIPGFVASVFNDLPNRAVGLSIPNYIRAVLAARRKESHSSEREQGQDTFQKLWRTLLGGRRRKAISVLEPACGSANDYRFLHGFGLARFLDYTGFDLCNKNIRNAKKLFPEARFRVGNAFEIPARDKAFDFCFVHDLFEHLSIEGMEASIAEICRVTRKAVCAHFFNMAEVQTHLVRPVDDYHWNTLSMKETLEAFLHHASAVQVMHIGTFLRWSLHCPETHNDGAYTFVITM